MPLVPETCSPFSKIMGDSILALTPLSLYLPIPLDSLYDFDEGMKYMQPNVLVIQIYVVYKTMRRAQKSFFFFKCVLLLTPLRFKYLLISVLDIFNDSTSTELEQRIPKIYGPLREEIPCWLWLKWTTPLLKLWAYILDNPMMENILSYQSSSETCIF